MQLILLFLFFLSLFMYFHPWSVHVLNLASSIFIIIKQLTFFYSLKTWFSCALF